VNFLGSNIVYVVISERFIDGDKFPYSKFQHPVCWWWKSSSCSGEFVHGYKRSHVI